MSCGALDSTGSRHYCDLADPARWRDTLKLTRPSIVDHAKAIRRCVNMALAGIHREFPCQMPLVFGQPTSIQRPRDWTPAFYGCYDWHSAVHSHWLLVRWLTLESPEETLVAEVRAALAANLTEENLLAEHRFLSHPDRASFERPYGLAWLLQLAAELRFLRDPLAAAWRMAIEPLERLAVTRFCEWLPKLQAPIRTGEHSQTAFALSLFADWARDAGKPSVTELVRQTALRFYSSDRDLPIQWEPSGHDFLSSSLATADVMRRILDPQLFSEWMSKALPGFPVDSTLRPVPAPADPRDGKLAHFVGLNFSRAWMLDGIASGLPHDDPRCQGLQDLAQVHLVAGIPMLDCGEYAVTHWVGSFAMYALTRAGLGR